MCGISGAIATKKSINSRDIKRMTDVIRHRGPDDEGFYFYNENLESHTYGDDSLPVIKEALGHSVDDMNNLEFTVALSHRRLSIIDTSSNGHQPMEHDNLVITYNGEIYNYIEIREQLRNKGYYFITDGDTEVILKAYLHWGEDCVKYFNGMWAFAIWDKENNKLFCSRDRLGEKPFYYNTNNENIVFASEIKQLLKYGIEPKVNEKIMFAALFYGIYDFSEETFFEGIYSLPGGYNMSIKIDKVNEKLNIKRYKYWNYNKQKSTDETSFEKASELLGDQLEKSISMRLRSDVEIGSCLSGGLDSSSIVSIASSQLRKKGFNMSKFKTFTACYDEASEVDERVYSDLVVHNSKCANYKIKPNTKKLKEDFEKVIMHQEEPFISMSIFAGWCVMEKAKNCGVKVLLDGQGGDETLLGYERFYAYYLKDLLTHFNYKEFAKEFLASSRNSKLKPKDLFAYIIYFNNKLIRKKRLSLKTKKMLNMSFSTRFRQLDILDEMLNFRSTDDVQANELLRGISHLLRYEDRNSMAHSIEARVPFLDVDFVELAISLPNRYKLKNGWTKAILRKYMEDKMPEEVTYRKNKLGFSVPQKMWIDELNDYFKETLLDNPRSSKYFNIDYIHEIFDKKVDQDARFKFIVVETWMRVFDVKS